jgi:hypothetical protein
LDVHHDWVVFQMNVAKAFNTILHKGHFFGASNNERSIVLTFPFCSSLLCHLTSFFFQSSFPRREIYLSSFLKGHTLSWFTCWASFCNLFLHSLIFVFCVIFWRFLNVFPLCLFLSFTNNTWMVAQ